MSGYRALLREQLELVGPPALAMLQNEAPIDDTILIAAAEAVGLLDPRALGTPALTDLHHALGLALRRCPPPLNLDLSPWSWSSDPDQQTLQVNQLVTLGGLAAAVPTLRAPLLNVLADIEASILLSPETVAGQSDLADRLRAELDLDDDHPASAPLYALSCAEGLAAVPLLDEAVLDRICAQASLEVFPPQRVAWLRLLRDDDFSHQVEQSMQAPHRIAAASGDGALIVPQLPRKTLYQRNGQELNLLLLQGSLVLEWFSEGAPAPESAVLLPGPLVLAPHPPPSGMEAGRYWLLPLPPEEAAAYRVRVSGPAGPLEVSLVPA